MSEEVFRRSIASRLEAADVPVPETSLNPLWLYYDLLARWNRRMNLTALLLESYPPATLDRLLVEPLLAASALPRTLGGQWVDLGSGGGSPAIPMKIARPDLALTMVEAKSRKAAFLREAIRTLELVQTEAVGERFETFISHAPATSDLITARAVRVDGALLELSAHLLKPGGILLLFGSRLESAPTGFAMREGTPHPRGDFAMLVRV